MQAGLQCVHTVQSLLCMHLEKRPAALLVEKGRDDGDPPNLSHSVLSNVGTRVATCDVSQCAHGRLYDILSTTRIVDCLQESLTGEERREVQYIHCMCTSKKLAMNGNTHSCSCPVHTPFVPCLFPVQ